MLEEEIQSKEMATTDETRRASIMSVEVPMSPASASSSYSDHEHDDRDFGEGLTPHISHASFGALGAIPTSLHRTYTKSSIATVHDPAFEIDFTEDDQTNPRNWSKTYRGVVLAIMSYGTTATVMFSTSYTSAIPGLQTDFGISEDIGILGVTTYLLGMAVGALILAPLSEMYGRRPVYVIANALFVVWIIPCAVATNIQTILIARFFAAFCAAAMISNAPGSVNDVTDDEHRALAFSIWSIGPLNGPVIGPVIGGFVFEYLGWRWTNWVALIAAAVAWVCTSLVGETYAPTILRKRAAKKRKETGDERWWSRYDESVEFWNLLKINLSRPFILTVTEPICIFWDIYIALVYGCLYLCFVAYPIVFSDIRGWSPGFSGLAFSGIGIGSMITICCEPFIRKMINAHKPDPETGAVPPEAMVSVVCIAAILIPLGEIWFAWTGTPTSIHWIVPIVAGIPFGAGNCAVFIYATNYLVHSYDVYAASALAGNAVLRSIMGACMPPAGEAMYDSLGSHWAGTLLALLEAAFIPVPFLFYRYGAKIRSKSALIRSMREDKEKQNARRRKAEERGLRRANAEVEVGGAMIGVGAMDEEVDGERDLEKGAAVRSIGTS